MLSIQHMRYSIFRVYLSYDLIRIVPHPCSKDHKFVKLRHFIEENVKPEPLGHVDFLWYSFDLDL